jgi:hypothetical protein
VTREEKLSDGSKFDALLIGANQLTLFYTVSPLIEKIVTMQRAILKI